MMMTMIYNAHTTITIGKDEMFIDHHRVPSPLLLTTQINIENTPHRKSS